MNKNVFENKDNSEKNMISKELLDIMKIVRSRY